MVTLRDLARLAGVSVNTVSRALNDKPDVSPQTRRRIKSLAAELGYQPNRIARGLRQQRTRTLGVVVADLVNPFFAEVIEGIERTASQEGYSILLTNSDERAERELEAVRLLAEQHVDGVLIWPTQRSDAPIRFLQARGIPFVLLGRHSPAWQAAAVVNDDRLGARMAVEHLLERGHRRILCINGPPYNFSAQARAAGYSEALARAGVPFDPALVLGSDARPGGAYAAIRRALAAGLSFTAVFCFSDYVAFGALQALQEAGRRVPQDVAVAGFDDIMFAAWCEPALTTVRIAKTRLGAVATQVAIGLIEQTWPAEQTGATVLAPQLVVRAST